MITHGTDTIEETSYFLNLVVKSRKPVVLTASMRPSTALSADGPLNFYNAVAVAANKDAVGRGVLVVINDWIHGASSLTKTSTTAVQTFLSPVRGLVGTVAYGKSEFYRGPVGKNTVDSEFSLDGVTALPRVDIIMAYENMDGKLIDAAVAAGAKGLVIAGVGNGNMTASALEALAAQSKKGIVCVRSTRVATGLVGRNVEVDDDKLGLIASDDLNPQKSRVLLRLALLKQRPLAEIQKLFQEYYMDARLWDVTVFSKNRDRLLRGDIAAAFFKEIVEQAREQGLISEEHFSVDGTLLEAWASQKSFQKKDEEAKSPSDDDPSNPMVNFRGEQRKNDTHQSTTDPDSRLFRKGPGREAKLSYLGHAVAENRNGLLVSVEATLAHGRAEREAALEMVKPFTKDGTRITLGADKEPELARRVVAGEPGARDLPHARTRFRPRTDPGREFPARKRRGDAARGSAGGAARYRSAPSGEARFL